MVHRLTDPYSYHESSEFDLDPATQLSETFSTSDLPKFKPIDDPRFHLKGFRATMSIKGIDPVLYPKIFPLSLDPICQKWFFSLDEKDIATWEHIAHSFMTRYKGNALMSTSLRELEILRQKEKEGFTTYLARWKETAAQLITTPPEKEMVKTFISSLLPKYRNHLRYLGLESFDKVYHIWVEIENDLLKGSNKNDKDGAPSSCVNAIETNQQKSKRKRRQYTPLGMSKEQAFDYLTTEGVLEPVGPTPDPMPHRRTKWWNPNEYCRYHRGNGHTTEKCFKFKDRIQDLIDNGSFHISYGNKKPNIRTNPLSVLLIDDEECSFDPTSYITPKTQCPRREYTPLGMTYTQAFDRLKAKGALSPIGPTADPPAERRSPRWDPNKYSKYHQGKGHDTEDCWTLKNNLQDMLDDGRFHKILTVNKED
ncbi:Activity-regulated cytoskeleton-associated protein [Bienertia sinuspersici]